MKTEIFNTWEEKWKEIPRVWKISELHRVGFSKDWVYFMLVQERNVRFIRIDRDTIDKLESDKN